MVFHGRHFLLMGKTLSHVGSFFFLLLYVFFCIILKMKVETPAYICVKSPTGWSRPKRAIPVTD